MLDYIYRIVTGFERQHGIRPNLLYINRQHLQHLKLSFDESLSMHQIMNLLSMELIIDPASVHPHVCWAQAGRRKAS